MRRLAAVASAVLTFAAAGAAQAATAVDPVGDFLDSYDGPLDADLDVTSFSVFFDVAAEVFQLQATFAGDIDPASPGLYAIGVNTGAGAIAPFGDIGHPNVIFDQVVVVLQNGAGFVGANPLSPVISGDSLSLAIPLALLPTTGFTARQYGWNLWPRSQPPGDNSDISDFAPENATITASVPEPATWAVMLTGFGLLGGVLRRRRCGPGVAAAA